MRKKQNPFFAGSIILAVLFLLAGGAFYVLSNKQEVSAEEPADIVFDFYRSWLDAVQAENTDPYQAGLAKAPILGKELRAKLNEAHKNSTAVDPVLCQTTPPKEITMRMVSSTEKGTEMLVTARKSASTEQAIVTLTNKGNGRYISDIRCSPGEFAPEREFSFDTQGRLLKDVPAPLNAEYWHLVFEENGVPGHYVPLFFSADSVCVAADGAPATCTLESYDETKRAHVKGQMTELGVNVVRMEFVK